MFPRLPLVVGAVAIGLSLGLVGCSKPSSSSGNPGGVIIPTETKKLPGDPVVGGGPGGKKGPSANNPQVKSKAAD
jgi:hypothetical protein